jgi:hypothetical protein
VKRSFFSVVILLILSMTCMKLHGQVVINGNNPYLRSTGDDPPKQAVGIAFTSLFWVDGRNQLLSGYSASLTDYRFAADRFASEKRTASYGVAIGYSRMLSRKMWLNVSFCYTKMTTGLSRRADLLAEEHSSLSQIGGYGSFRLGKNPGRRFGICWLLGPELNYVRRKVNVRDYVEDPADIPAPYRQDVTVLEGSVVTGPGVSFRASAHLSLFSNALMGISLPGKGFKCTLPALGLEYGF